VYGHYMAFCVHGEDIAAGIFGTDGQLGGLAALSFKFSAVGV